MADSKRYLDWYAKAKTDYSSASILAEHGGDYSIIAFHCQQAAEKALKGLLLEETETLSDAHSLIYLCKQAAKLEPKVCGFLKDCAYLNQFYIETRYPADDPMEIEESEMAECMRIAKDLLDIILSRKD
jgi:HEPN domain-containing protein